MTTLGFKNIPIYSLQMPLETGVNILEDTLAVWLKKPKSVCVF